jgi:hypothetical protein
LCGTLGQFPILALTLQRGELLPFFLRLDYDHEHEHEHEREFVIRKPRRCVVKASASSFPTSDLSPSCRLYEPEAALRPLISGFARLCLAHSPKRTKSVELLDLDRMRSVYPLLEHGTGQLITLCLKGLFVGVELRPVANQDPVFSPSGIHVIRSSLVFNRRKLAFRQCAYAFLLFGRRYRLPFEPCL